MIRVVTNSRTGGADVYFESQINHMHVQFTNKSFEYRVYFGYDDLGIVTAQSLNEAVDKAVAHLHAWATAGIEEYTKLIKEIYEAKETI